MSDTSFTFDGERYTSLMDFLLTDKHTVSNDLPRQEEDRLRSAIAAYTEAILDRQAERDASAEDTELHEAVKIVANIVEWGRNIAGRTGLDPWEDADKFLALPYVKLIRQQLKLEECKDHWHCEYSVADPEAHHEDAKADRNKPCPTCHQPEGNEHFTERCLEALKTLRLNVGRAADPTLGAYAKLIAGADAILAEGRQKGLLP